MNQTDSTNLWEDELTTCPDCGGHVIVADKIESNSEGVAFGYIECADCDFHAREEWVHDRTIRVGVDNE